MKKAIWKIGFTLILLATLLTFGTLSMLAAEADLVYALETSSSVVEEGDIVTIDVYISKNRGFLAAIAQLQYDGNALAYEGYSLDESAYSEVVIHNPTSGNLKITVGNGLEAMFSPDSKVFDNEGQVVALTFRVLGNAVLGETTLLLDVPAGNVLTPAKDFSYTVAGASVTLRMPTHQHSIELMPIVMPTCVGTGLTEGERCSTCGEVLVAQNVLAPTGVHTFGEWTLTIPATETAEGLETRICTACDASETRVVDKLSANSQPTDDKPQTSDEEPQINDDGSQPNDAPAPDKDDAPVALIVGIAVGIIALVAVGALVLKKRNQQPQE